jgi:hypothetical protein
MYPSLRKVVAEKVKAIVIISNDWVRSTRRKLDHLHLGSSALICVGGAAPPGRTET